MKTTALIAALALAAGTAFAQSAPATSPADTTTSAPSQQKAGGKKVSKKKTGGKAKKKSTQSMGAGAANVETDLDAGARRARMDEAYANWRKM
jgi:hypothetical protein